MDTIQPNVEQEAFFIAAFEAFKATLAAFPTMTNMECCVILGRLAGLAVQGSGEDRVAMRELVIATMDQTEGNVVPRSVLQ